MPAEASVLKAPVGSQVTGPQRMPGRDYLASSTASSKVNMASLWRLFDNYFSETLDNTNEPAYPPENVEQKLKMILEVLLNFALSPSDDLTTTMPLPLWQS